jgi:6-phosphogluconolactonase
VPASSPHVELVVGTYRRAGGAGLHRLTYAPSGERWLLGKAEAAIRDASFGLRVGRRALHVFAEESGDGAVAIWRQEQTRWSLVARHSTRGEEPCHLALDASETCLAVANYGSGSIALFAIDRKSGALAARPQLHQGEGCGPNRERQDASHMHWVGFSPDQRWLHAVDLGSDAVLSFAFNAAAGTIGEPLIGFRAPAGSGPRHLLFHPHHAVAWLVSELASTVTMLGVEGGGRFRELATASTLPTGVQAPGNLAGAMALNQAADRLYVTNRGDDSVMVFALDERGAMRLIERVPSGGSSPRMALLLEAERRLVVVNEEGNLTVFRIGVHGTLEPLDVTVAVPGAAFVSLA